MDKRLEKILNQGISEKVFNHFNNHMNAQSETMHTDTHSLE